MPSAGESSLLFAVSGVIPERWRIEASRRPRQAQRRMVRFWLRNIYLSVEPAMRGWVSAVANYSEPVALGAVMRSPAFGRVEESRSSDFHPGEYVTGMFGWQDYAVVDAEAIERDVGGSGLSISTSLGVLGLNGLTAYFRPPGDWPA
jgi:NADPH-dependent curcumin reductase CurA